MIQILLHFWGDFVFQTDHQALGKKKPGWVGTWCCLKHCITYSLPFLFMGSYSAIVVIFITHYIIDRTHLIEWLIAFKNGVKTIENFGFGAERPFAITIWLMIIVDNLFHVTINFLALRYL